MLTLKKVKDRKTNKLAKKRRESYSVTEMIGIVLFFPFSLLFYQNPLTEFGELAAGNYKKKILQRIFLILISLFLWAQLLRLII